MWSPMFPFIPRPALFPHPHPHPHYHPQSPHWAQTQRNSTIASGNNAIPCRAAEWNSHCTSCPDSSAKDLYVTVPQAVYNSLFLFLFCLPNPRKFRSFFRVRLLIYSHTPQVTMGGRANRCMTVNCKCVFVLGTARLRILLLLPFRPLDWKTKPLMRLSRGRKVLAIAVFCLCGKDQWMKERMNQLLNHSLTYQSPNPLLTHSLNQSIDYSLNKSSIHFASKLCKEYMVLQTN